MSGVRCLAFLFQHPSHPLNRFLKVQLNFLIYCCCTLFTKLRIKHDPLFPIANLVQKQLAAYITYKTSPRDCRGCVIPGGMNCYLNFQLFGTRLLFNNFDQMSLVGGMLKSDWTREWLPFTHPLASSSTCPENLNLTMFLRYFRHLFDKLHPHKYLLI